jgi:hypothetical protein
MLVSIIIFLAAIAACTVLMVIITRRVGAAVGRIMNDRLKAAQQILETGCVPSVWRGSGGDPSSCNAMTKRRYIRRLTNLIRALEQTPVFSDPESRHVVLEGLHESLVRWRRDDWQRPLEGMSVEARSGDGEDEEGEEELDPSLGE